MMLIDNRNYLRLHHRPLMEQLVKWEKECANNENVQVEPSRKDVPTLKMDVEGRPQYIHSKYDPQTEAERLVAGIDSLAEYNHILLVGIGLGYHLEELLKKYPAMRFSIYEPNIEVLYQFLSYQNILSQYAGNLQTIFTGTEEAHIRQSMYQMHQMNFNKTFIYTLPVYQKLYAEEEHIVINVMKELLKDKRSILATSAAFQKRWTLNAIKNFPFVIQTPNILHDIDQTVFQDKPAIIVSAGPSLNEEFENLKYIKENGLAYIFSVGSAINALIEHDIYPDVVCTYDPKERNQNVIKIIKERNITEIPLVFGSSVGYETLMHYPGPMLHMITSQDTIAPCLIHDTQSINIIQDAPSIAVITFQMLGLLGVSQILLVGQNLGYLNNVRFADGIKYKHISNELSEQEKAKLIKVKDVYGGEMYTSESYIQMKNQLERYTKNIKNIEVINTTKGGAHIEGTAFIPLSEVITDQLEGRQVVVSNWWNTENQYDRDLIQQRQDKIASAKDCCSQLIESVNKELKELDDLVSKHQLKKLEKKFEKFDKEFKQLRKNEFYKAFIEPMLRVQFQSLLEKNQMIKFENDLFKKGRTVVEIFGYFLQDCHEHFQFVEPYANELIEMEVKK